MMYSAYLYGRRQDSRLERDASTTGQEEGQHSCWGLTPFYQVN